jgi:cytochrome c oxidase subunit 3/cytochrome o ubiquinol oxidase subunit 3
VTTASAPVPGHVAHARDSHGGEHATTTGLDHRKMLWWAFLGSECMFFGSLIATYLVYKGRDTKPPFPHNVVAEGKVIPGVLNIPLTSFSTFVLLMSSFAVVMALSGLNENNIRKFRFWLVMVIVGGLIFLGCQAYEFNHFYHQGLSLQSNLFGATFYTLTGFHGAHVSVGVLWLITVLVWSFRGGITAANAINFEICGLYWHFVDVVWIAIFTLIYLIP